MTTSAFTSPIDSDTDANFRAWGSQIGAQLAAVGLTQSADTGQINWATVSIAGYPGIVGYEIWEFNDPGQGTAPIFFKIGYGAASATNPNISFQIGSGSDGTGNITGSLKSNTVVGSGTTALGSALPSFICYRPADGFLGVALKCGLQSVAYGGLGFIISRTNDTAGVVTDDAINVYLGVSTGGSTEQYMMAPGVPLKLPISGNFTANGQMATWPQNLTTSFAGGSIQAVPIFALAPQIQVNAKMSAVILSEVPVGTTFNLAVVGLTPRTFVCVGGAIGAIANANSTYAVAMLWE